MRGERRIELVKAPARLDATAECELGLVAIALLHPSMRAEIHELCLIRAFLRCCACELFSRRYARSAKPLSVSTNSSASDCPRSSKAASRRSRSARWWTIPASARKLAEDYILALSRRQTRREVDQLKRATTSAPGPDGGDDDAVANVQAVIELKKREERERRNAS